MSRDGSLPDYERLFGELDVRPADESRSVYAPAAYLVELLRLLGDVEGASLLQRRADIPDIVLDGTNTTTELPYLDVVNEVLERAVGATPYEQLRTSHFPFDKPFSLGYQRLRTHLLHMGLDPVELAREFGQADQDEVARERLGLSPEEVGTITVPRADEAGVRESFGLTGDEPLTVLEDVTRFRRATGLGATEVPELLWQRCAGPTPETTGFFVHQGTPVSLENQRLVRDGGLTPEWLDRVSRFVRLARRAGMSLTELDLVLRQCCSNVLDRAAVRVVAVVKALAARLDLPVDVVCSLVAPMDTVGLDAGATGAAACLFGRTFDTPRQPVIRPWPGTAPAGRDELTCTGDVLAPVNHKFRRRVAAAVGFAESDLVAVVTSMRQHFGPVPSPFDTGEFGLGALSLLHRTAKLTTALGTTVAELFQVLTALDRDPALRRHTTFPVPVDITPVAQDPYRMLDAEDPLSALWLVQTLAAVFTWLTASGFTGEDLAALAAPEDNPADRTERLEVRTALRERAAESGVAPEVFESPRFGTRAARVVHDVLAHHEGVVSPGEPRLLRLDAAAVPGAAFDAVTALASVTAADFLDLGLADSLAEKAFSNLVLHGYLGADGTVVDAAIPAGIPLLAKDFSSYRDELFELIRSLHPTAPMSEVDTEDDTEDDTGSADDELDDTDDTDELDELDDEEESFGDDVADPEDNTAPEDDTGDDTDEPQAELDTQATAFFFPSDLAQLSGGALDATARAELYDNLIHNGYLDAGGEVADAEFFADPANAAHLRVNAELDDVAGRLGELLRARAAAWQTTPVDLDAAAFADLALTDDVVTELLANLRFNGYRDDAGRYRDKAAVAALRLDDLALSPEFEPHRADVLSAMQDQLAGARAAMSEITVDDLRPLADAVMAARVLKAVDGGYVVDGRVRPELWPALTTPAAELPPLPETFDASAQRMIRGRLATIVRDQRPYRLDPAAVAALGVTADEARTLLTRLVQAGDLDLMNTIPQGRLAYFAASANAVTYPVTGFADYQREVFFLLHTVALATVAAVDEVAATLATQAKVQEAALFSVLQDALGVPPETVASLCRVVCGNAVDAVVALMGTGLSDDDARSRLAYRRIHGFARVAAKLGLSATDVEVVFADQDLVGKYPEALTLPPGVERFDALLESADGTVSVFAGTTCYRYAASTYVPLDLPPVLLADLSPVLGQLVAVDAAFARPDGTEWLTGRDAAGVAHTFSRQRHSTRWAEVAQAWGTVRSTFTDPDRIDAAFVDEDGRTYLFCGDQYVRYTNTDFTYADPGYPRPVAQWWAERGAALPEPFATTVDAVVRDADGRMHLFSGTRCLTVGDAGDKAAAEVWGRTPVTLANHVDAAYADESAVHLIAGNLVVRHLDDVENAGLRMADGYPRTIAAHFPGVPAGFDSGLDAVLRDATGAVHLFRDGRTVTLGTDTTSVATATRWGRQEAVLDDGRVDSVLTGLDGHTYVFNGPRFVRYSGSAYTTADLGYPRTIAGDWGGLRAVGASFVLDGHTYLFGPAGDLFDTPLDWAAALAEGRLSPLLRGRFGDHAITFAAAASVVANEDGTWQLVDERGAGYIVRRRNDRLTVAAADDTRCYVRYSTKDYTAPDAGYPRPLTDDWWNLPEALGAGLADVDTVFTGRDGMTYLISGGQFVVFDARRRWWSEPRTLREHWDSLPFDRVDAAFLGRDGRTYVFSGTEFVRYSTAELTRVDDRYPATVATVWGQVPNALARTGRVDAALVHDTFVTVDGLREPRTYTYLFSGDQYVRYLGTGYDTVEEGYPAPLSALATEPGMAALPVVLSTVDAAFADLRSVHLFDGTRWHVVSDALYRNTFDISDVQCAFVEDGALLIEGADGWRHTDSLDAPRPETRPVRPRVLRTVPQDWRTGLDAVLTGADGNTYLFRAGSCFDVRLGVDNPVARAWGRPHDTITRDGVVDAAFVGRDGITYVFRGDQFVSFARSTNGYDRAVEQTGPLPVAEHWGGLVSVALAYVDGPTTYVFEHPDSTGRMRFVAYSGTGYATPDAGYPRAADAGFWSAPEGFGIPAAVLAHDGTTVLVAGGQFVRRAGTGPWSLPQPADLLWHGFGDGATPEGSVVRTAFTGRDGAVHVFFTSDGVDHYTRYTGGAFGASLPVREAWAYPAFDHVDAAYVDPAGTTFLFSGNRYARYSTASYRDADLGYPKPITANLRAETTFAGVPESFEDTIVGHKVDAVAGDDRSVFVFTGGKCYIGSRTLYAERRLDMLGHVRNELAETGRVDATLRTPEHTYLFAGDQYVRYTDGRPGPFVDDGYPRTIEGSLAADLGVPELPEAFRDGLDAAARDADGGVHLFRGENYLRADVPAVRPLTEVWGRVRTEFGPGLPLDAAFTAPAGELYAFRGDQYVRYSDLKADLTTADPGYPRTIRDDWGDLPTAFEAGIDGAFTLAGATYLLRDGDYVRYTDGYRAVDRTFPQPIGHRFSRAADYRLTDLDVISCYARLARISGGDLGMLLAASDEVEDPYERLHDIFGWDAGEVRWVQRHRAFLTAAPGEEDRFEVELLLRADELFTTADRVGTLPSRLHAAVVAPGDPDAATTALLDLLSEVLSPDDFATYTARVHDDLAEVRRDALVSAVLATNPAPTPGTLFERFFLDVDMGAQGTTSRVREAIGAAQLYLNRYLLDLEPVGAPSTPADDEHRTRVRQWWSWLRNYRTWEANRKVFLYPENYLRPELRSDKTAAFRQLENDLLQGGITAETAEAAYRRYLDEYTEVSRLAISGGFVHEPDSGEPGTQELILFGRTRTSPRRHYWRSAVFHPGGDSAWAAWAPVKVQIGAEQVYPVSAFGRVFVFWVVAENAPVEQSGQAVIVSTHKKDEQRVTGTPVRQRTRVSFSFRTLNQDWVPAQELGVGTDVDGLLHDEALAVRTGTVDGSADGHPAIVVTATAIAQNGQVTRTAFTLTPELHTATASGATTEPPRTTDLGTVFGPEELINATDVVWFGSPQTFRGGPWFSVDHKGGSVLCRPVRPDVHALPSPIPVRNDQGMPDWDTVDTAVELPDRSRLCFDKAGGRYTIVHSGQDRTDAGQRTLLRWGPRKGSLTENADLDAALTRGDSLFVFAGHQYLRYTPGSAATSSQPDPGYPRNLAGNTEHLPPWTTIDHVHTADGVEYFFSLQQRGWVTSTDLTTLHQFPGPRRGPRTSPASPAERVALLNDLASKAGMGAPFPLPVPDPLPSVDLATRWSTVDAAMMDRDTGQLYLTSGIEFARYPLGVDGTIAAEPAATGDLTYRVSGFLQLDGSRFAFRGNDFAELAPGSTTPLLPFTPTADRWADMPTGFRGTFDGADEFGFFVKGGYLRVPRSMHRPVQFGALRHAVTRLTSSTAYKLNERLLLGGVGALLDTSTQRIGELPAFRTDVSGATTVRVQADRVDPGHLPSSAHLDFDSANGTYYWEIFFHAPLLIAQALTSAQRFEEARTWFEYVFDPTRPSGYWRFLPFLADDPIALAEDLRARLDAMGTADDAVAALAARLAPALATLDAVGPAFRGGRALTDADRANLAALAGIDPGPVVGPPAAFAELTAVLDVARELTNHTAADGHTRADLLQAYRDDPFDPHAVAALRPVAYRRAAVMAYVDNVIDWADLLFRQYTPESIDEARMLYVLAQDLLGPRPEAAGPRPLPADRSFAQLEPAAEDEDPAAPAELVGLTAAGTMLTGPGEVHAGVADRYFHVPANDTLVGYWDVVTDRLGKIRRSLDILGVSRPVPLFAPPIDPMALVRAVAGGGSVAAAMLALSGPVPHHRFPALLRRAQDLTDRLRQYGQDLLQALERRDGEQLSLLQNRQDGELLAITLAQRQLQVEMAQAGLRSSQAAKASAQARREHYQQLVDNGLSAEQRRQMETLNGALAMNITSSVLKVGAAVAHVFPQMYAGLFNFGAEFGGKQIGDALQDTAQVTDAVAQSLSNQAEILSLTNEQNRTKQEWQFEVAVADHDLDQLDQELAVAEGAVTVAQEELALAQRQAAHQLEVATFLQGKFTGAELYQWTSERLGALYFQAYGLAEDTARAAERAFRFERGVPEDQVAFIRGAYWDDRRRGLLAGDTLNADLDRMAKAYADGDTRDMEITKRISLRELDPLALLRLRAEGSCTFSLTEDLFDRDFPGHYRRQVRTVAVELTGADGAATRLPATLTQTTHRTVMAPDQKAVKHLLDPQGPAPATVRVDWRADQQIALSDVPEGYDNNGMFEVRYDDDRYLPFEGTGAVGTWRIDLTGRRPSDVPGDVTLTLRYTAESGGDVFATAVKGMLKPRPAALYLDVAAAFPEAWADFTEGRTSTLPLPLTPADLPGMSGSRITGLQATYVLAEWAEGGPPRLLVNGDRTLLLAGGKLLGTPGLSLGPNGLTLTPDRGTDPADLANLVLVVTYRATA